MLFPHGRKFSTFRRMKSGIPFDRGKMDQQQQDLLQRLQQCRDSTEIDDLYESSAGNGYVDSVYIKNWIIKLHGKFGNPHRSREAFDRIPQKNIYSWSMMIAAYAQTGHCTEAFALFERMQREGVRPNSVTCIHLLGACCSRDDLAAGSKLHRYIETRIDLKQDMTLQTSLINMYAKCGGAADARAVFDGMDRRDTVAWNAMAGAFTRNGPAIESLKLLREMDLQGVKANASTYGSIIRGCASSSSTTLPDCNAIEQRVVESGYSSQASIQNAIINLFAKSGDLQNARNAFNRLESKDVVSWSSMISAYTQSGRYDDAVGLYIQMQADGSVEPNSITFVGVVRACTGSGEFSLGRSIHRRIESMGLETGVELGSALLQMYTKSGSLDDAERVFDRIAERDILCWNFMLLAYSEIGSPNQVLEAYEVMDSEPNAVTYTTVLIACSAMEAIAEGLKVHSRIVDSGVESDTTMETALLGMYIKFNRLKEACRVFETMATKDVMAWNYMMIGYIDHDYDSDALMLYGRMRDDGVDANNITFANVFKACSKLRDLETGIGAEAWARKLGLETDAVTDTALLNMYAACGDLAAARKVFDDRRDRRRDVIFYTAMIASYAQAGRGDEALALYKEMLAEEIKPNSVTYTSVLSACSTLGDVVEGRKIHSSLEGAAEEFDLAVQNSLLSMYARCGSLRESSRCFDGIRNRDADTVSWTAMVAAYAHHGHSDRALEMVYEMELCGVSPDAVTFQSVLHACSHQGSLQRGLSSFVAMGVDYGVEPGRDHYLCVVDLLARAGRLAEARELIEVVGLSDESMGWMMLLGASRVERNVDMGLRAAQGVHLEDGYAMCSLLCSF